MYQVIVLAVVAALVGIDQLMKWAAVSFLQNQPAVPVIKNVFEFQYVENRAAAFGLGGRISWLFVPVTLVIVGFLLYVLLRGKYRSYRVATISAILIIAGGVGNMIDRLARGYVVDFVYFKLIDFPVFNFADCCVVVGAIMLLIYVFFFYSYDREPAKSHKSDPSMAETRVISLPDDAVTESARAADETKAAQDDEKDVKPLDSSNHDA